MKTYISIIVPCYNQAQYLNDALNSVMEQTYPDWECIIVNDGSPDNTEAVAQEWLAKDNRFKYVFQKNGGLSSARNAGIENAIGDFILPLDADDKIAKNYLALAIDEFKKDSSLKIVYCKAEKFGEETGIWNLEPFKIKSLALRNMIFCTAMFKKEDWIKVSGYDLNIIDGYEDWEFWIAILKDGGGVKQLNIVGFYYRMKPNSMVQILSYEKKKLINEYVSVKHASFYVAQFGSFQQLNFELEKVKYNFEFRLKDKKYIAAIFCKTFFGFTFSNIFKKYK